jgi:hypothetical protein
MDWPDLVPRARVRAAQQRPRPAGDPHVRHVRPGPGAGRQDPDAAAGHRPGRAGPADGKLRADLRPTDVLFIEFMLTSAAGYAEQVSPQVWRRYLALLTDALRPARAGTTPLPVPALVPDEMAAVMRSIPHGRS